MKFSKNTLKLLKFFYNHPEQQFYIQELGRCLKTKPGVFQRALYALEKQGLLLSSFKANARFFSLNKGYPLYNEFRKIVEKMASIMVIALILLAGSGMGFCAEKEGQDIQIQSYGLNISQADILGARSEFLPKLNVELDAKRLYYGLLLAYETKRIAEDLVQQAQSHYQEVGHNFKQGTSSI